MVNMSNISKECGVSQTVVSLVLNGRDKEVGISAQTRERVLAAANELGYCRNELARAIVTGHNNVVAIIVCGDTSLEFTQRIIEGALNAASMQNYSVKLFQPRPQELDTTIRKLQGQKVAGVLIHDASIDILTPWLRKFKKLGIPCGVFNLLNPTEIGFGIYSDDRSGMESAVEYLANLGHRRIAHLTTKDQPFEFEKLRRSGYLDGMKKYSPEEPRILEGISWGIDSNLELLFSLLDEPVETRPTAVVCATDYLAAELFHAAYLRKKFIPEEMSVIGFGGLKIGEYLPMPLTTVRQPFREMGNRAMETLLNTIQNKESSDGLNIKLETEITINQSCRKLSSKTEQEDNSL